MYCKACGTVSETSAKYCSRCGQLLGTEQVSAKLPFWRSLVSPNVIGTIIVILLVLGWFDIVQSVRSSVKIQTYQVSGFVVWSGILAAVLARKRKFLWFLAGAALSVPAMILAGAIGGFLR
jgi:hypothetical protein